MLSQTTYLCIQNAAQVSLSMLALLCHSSPTYIRYHVLFYSWTLSLRRNDVYHTGFSTRIHAVAHDVAPPLGPAFTTFWFFIVWFIQSIINLSFLNHIFIAQIFRSLLELSVELSFEFRLVLSQGS